MRKYVRHAISVLWIQRYTPKNYNKKQEKGMFGFLLTVAATPRVPEAAASAIVKYIETADTYISIITFITIFSGGVV